MNTVSTKIHADEAVVLLNLTVQESHGNTFRGPCPACDRAGGRSLVISREKDAYYCFHSKKGGDLISLAAHVRQVGQEDAAQFLMECATREKPTKKEKTEPPKFDPLSNQKSLDPDHPSVAALGITPEDARRLGIGYTNRGILKNSVAFTIRNPDGSIAGFVGVETAKVPKKWL